MDILLTVLMWIGGFIAFGVLSMSFAFAAGGAAQTGKIELKVISGVSLFLMLFLLWMAGSTVLSSAVFEGAQNTLLVKESQAASSETAVVEKNNATNINLWIFYGFFFITFFSWLFTPSKDKESEKGSITKKIIGCMLLKRDDSGLQAWDPNWKSKE